MSKTLVIGYWDGILPNNVNLHFRSFKAHRGDSKYLLFLEDGTMHKDQIKPELQWIFNDDDIEVRKISLEGLMYKYDIKRFCKLENIYIERLQKFILNRFCKINLIRRALNKIKYGFYNDVFGWYPSHTTPFGGISQNKTFRADIFRSIIPSEYPQMDIFWTDLDIVFIRSLEILKSRGAFISRWAEEDFGNNAIIYLPQNRKDLREDLLTRLRSGSPAYPWCLYSSDYIDRYGLKVLEPQECDPLFNRKSLIKGDKTLFFRRTDLSVYLYDEFCEYLMIHWHNCWDLEVEESSPYDLFLKLYSEN